ncbi:MAG: APC family permease [Coxiellaceae bacterium]|nr:APC family permease [Coxiellaceae bacterium]
MKKLGVFSLAMITLGSVDSIRNLPATALFGSSLVFYFLLGAVMFLLPSALVSAELSSTSKLHGGIYSWVKQAFGPKVGFLAVWFQWTENVIWYPTILSFVAGSIGYLISPSLAQNKVFLVSVILVAFWGTTIINLLGIRSSARFANFAAMVGLLLPMTLIIALGVVWLYSGKPIQISFTAQQILPHSQNSGMLVALTGIMMSFCGMEIATVHSGDVDNPKKAFPRAMLISVLVLVFTLMAGSLSIASVIPEHQISLVAGIMQAFSVFFNAYHMHWILPLMAVMLVIGGLGGVSNWIIAPTRGLQLAAKDGNLPKHFQASNRHGAPKVLLLYQAIISTIMTMAFLLMPSVNGSYWLLTALAAQQYMLMYMIMFVTSMRWRFLSNQNEDGYRIPGGNFGICLVSGMGFIGALVTFIIGFIPPDNINVGGTLHYEELIWIGLIVMTVLPFVFRLKKDSKN